jgi:hypothetical protein
VALLQTSIAVEDGGEKDAGAINQSRTSSEQSSRAKSHKRQNASAHPPEHSWARRALNRVWAQPPTSKAALIQLAMDTMLATHDPATPIVL